MKSPTRSPSELRFGSLLVYAPQGTTPLSIRSREVVRHVKNGRANYLARIGSRFEESWQSGRFVDLLGPDILLVPAPRSSPDIEDMNWPALRISRELEARELCAAVACLLERHTPVAKSALASRGAERPSPEQHAASIRCRSTPMFPPSRITIVDDVVTRGSTLLACAWVLAERFPRAAIGALAVVRTMSGVEIESILEPLDTGTIRLLGSMSRRDP